MKKWFIVALLISVCPVIYNLLRGNISGAIAWLGILAIAVADVLIFVIVSKLSSAKSEINPAMNNR